MKRPLLCLLFVAGCTAQNGAGPRGPTGERGTAGTNGTPGANGTVGASGAMGAPGSNGAMGSVGATGPSGAAGSNGTPGSNGTTGPTGAVGLTGPTGASAPSEFAYFFALMPGDNAATVAPGAAVEFPQDGPTSAIMRASPSVFTLPSIGVYDVSWQVSVTEPGQLVLVLDSNELSPTVAGRATGTSQIVGHALITTTVINSTLSVKNPTGNSTALTITPLAGGTHPVSAGIVIRRLF